MQMTRPKRTVLSVLEPGGWSVPTICNLAAPYRWSPHSSDWGHRKFLGVRERSKQFSTFGLFPTVRILCTITLMKAAIYARVSTTDQNCELQLRELREYASRRGLILEQ